MRPLYACLAGLLTMGSFAQQPVAGAVTSVNQDHSITFRYANGGARTVLVETDAVPKAMPMQKGEGGVWTADDASAEG